MRHRRTRHKIGRDSAHRDATLMNLAGSLITHGRIRTTLSKAKATRPYVEKLVTTARTNTVHNQRLVRKQLHMADTATARKAGQPTVVQRLFNDIAPRFVDRPGGYTRIVKLGPRPGDAAPMAFLEWVDYIPQPKAQSHAGHSHAHTHDHDHAAAAGA
jgi:large subunit ribosomal protein L17